MMPLLFAAMILDVPFFHDTELTNNGGSSSMTSSSSYQIHTLARVRTYCIQFLPKRVYFGRETCILLREFLSFYGRYTRCSFRFRMKSNHR